MKSVQVWSDKVQDANGVGQPIYAVIFTDDGLKLVATAGSEILIYNASEGGLIKALKAHKDTVTCLAPLNGGGFASGGADKNVIIWSCALQGTLKFSHNDSIQSISQNSVTGILLTCSSGDFGLWSVDVKAVPKTKVHSRIVSSAWSSDGQLFALGFFDGLISIRASTGEEQIRIEKGVNPIWALKWTPKEPNILVVADWSQCLSFYDHEGNQVGKDRIIGYDPCALSYSSQGDYMAMGGSNRKLNILTSEGIEVGLVCTREGWIWSSCFKADTPVLAVGSADGSVTVYRIDFNLVSGIYGNTYGVRQNMTEVVIQGLDDSQKITIKCRSLVKLIALYQNLIAIRLANKIVIYERDEEIKMRYRIKDKFSQTGECSALALSSNYVIISTSNIIEILNFKGDKINAWDLDDTITYLRLIGGSKKKESFLVGLKSGASLKLSVANASAKDLIQIQNSIKWMDLNLEKNQLAIVDQLNSCSIYTVRDKKLIHQELNVIRVHWNSEYNDSICYSSATSVTVKVGGFVAHQQQISGKVVIALKGRRLYLLDADGLIIVDISFAVPMDGYIALKDFESAYRVACFGVPESDWERLGSISMDHLHLDISKKAYSRTRNYKKLDSIATLEKSKKDSDLFKAEVYAYGGKFEEAARMFKRSGNAQKAVEMFSDLHMWDEATRASEEGNESKGDILRKKAQMQEQRKDILAAAETYELVGEYGQVIELLGKNGKLDRLMDIVRKVKEDSLLRKCLIYFRAARHSVYSLETIRILDDKDSLLGLYLEMQDWENIFKFGEENNGYWNQIYLAYGNWLAISDRFEEAQEYYTKAGNADEAIKILQFLANGAVEQARYRKAAHYYWSLSKEILRRGSTEEWRSYLKTAQVYFAYSYIYQYVEDPFTFCLQTTLLRSSNYLVNNLKSKPYLGISKVYVLYCLATISTQLNCFKMARFAYDNLARMVLPLRWRDSVALATIKSRAHANVDDPELLSTCFYCSFKAPSLVQQQSNCLQCHEPIIYSFASFASLPLILFTLEDGVSSEEALELINSEPSEGPQDLEYLLATKPLIFDRNQLARCGPQKVFIRDYGSDLVPIEYYLLVSDDIYIIMCDSCMQFFVEEEWNYEIVVEGKCPFCKHPSKL